MAKGYGRYEYETSPRKLEPEILPKKKRVQTPKDAAKKEIHKKAKENVKSKNQTMRRKKQVVMYICVVFVILLAISYRNSLINENFSKVKNLKSELSSVEKENQQLQVSIESSLNLNNIEQLAKEKLGMQKLNSNQKVYINLPKKDYVQPAAEQVEINQNQNPFEKILNQILGK